MNLDQADRDPRSGREPTLPCALCGGAPPRSDGVPAWFGKAYGTLTGREREVAVLVARGLQNRDIALILGTSHDTVRKQTIRIYAKLNASGRTELAVWMTAAGYVSLAPHGRDH